MSTRAQKRAAAEARRRTVEIAEHIIHHAPLWPWDASQWEVPAPPEKRGRGRPPKPERPVDRMMTARAILNRRYVKKAATAKATAPKAAAARRKDGDRLRKRVVFHAHSLIEAKVPARRLTSRIVEILASNNGPQYDVKHIREILKDAGILPAK